MLGSLIAIRGEKKGYGPDHVRLMRLLNEPFAIALSNYMRYQELNQLKELLEDDNRYFQNELKRNVGNEIVGADYGLKSVVEQVHRVAPLNSPVLLLGETGTGKEVIAAAIHNLSKCSEGPFIQVNCGAIPESLMDSELFGHEKGAFTGAAFRKRGRFERAHNGTIFLDEVGELSLEAQVRLLRVLQEKRFERVGGEETVEVNVRVIAATHRDLDNMLSESAFREDLYYRLRVFPVYIPPLRDRRSDIPNFVHYFIRKKSMELGLNSMPYLTAETSEHLMNYHWPGNVRELENAIERALILNRGDRLDFPDLNSGGKMIKSQPLAVQQETVDELSLDLDGIVTRHIEKVLKLVDGKIYGPGGAAELLKVNPSTLRNRMKKMGILFGRRSARQFKQ